MKVPILSELKANGIDPEYLFWVGCAGSFDERSKKVTKAFIKILNKANVSFAILGKEESCTGDPAKRAGNEFLFQMQALTNIELMNNYGVEKIVTTCPHDYNTLKNEYKGLGGNYDVYHHTEYISQLLADGRINIKGDIQDRKIVYHDPCYLGRGNNVYIEPRKVIESLGVNVIEMKRSKRSSFCCGAGGSQMFKDPESGDKEINIERTEEALQSNPDIIATACAFCNIMITDGVKSIDEGSAEVIDIAELIADNI